MLMTLFHVISVGMLFSTKRIKKEKILDLFLFIYLPLSAITHDNGYILGVIL